MTNLALTIIEIGLTILIFLLSFYMIRSVDAYYQMSTESMLHMMNTLEDTLPTNYANPYGTPNYTNPYDGVSNLMSPLGLGLNP
jgi:hypothetical protein